MKTDNTGTGRRRRRAWTWPSRWAWAQVLVALLVTASVATLWFTRAQAGPLARLDGQLQDAQTRWRGTLAPGTVYPILLVRFDDASAARFARETPDRAQLADVLVRLQASQPRLIAFDHLPAGGDPAGDAALAAAMHAGAPVLLPVPSSAVARSQAFATAEGLPRSALLPTAADAPPEPLASAAKALGHVVWDRDPDGARRHALPALPLGDAAYPSLALRIAGDAMRQPWTEATLRWSRDIRWGSLRVPLDLLSRQRVNDYGPAATFPSVSMAALIDGRVPEDAVHNRIVIVEVPSADEPAIRPRRHAVVNADVGSHAIDVVGGSGSGSGGGSGSGDREGTDAFMATPFAADLPSAERLATVVDNILTGRVLSQPVWATTATLVALLALPLLCALMLSRGRLWRGAIGVALLIGAVLGAAQWLFVEEFLVIPLGHALFGAAAASVAALLVRALAAIARWRATLQRLRLGEERLALAAQGANDGLWDWDVAGDRLTVSPRWIALMGEDGAPPRPDGIDRFTRPLDPEAVALFRADLDAHLQGRSVRFHHVLRFVQGGQPRALLVRGQAVREPVKPARDDAKPTRDGAPAGRSTGMAVRMSGALTDIGEYERGRVDGASDALRDRLTGVANRTLFVELLAQRLASPVPGVPVGYAVVALDDFPSFVERHGRLAADAVLAEVGRRLGGGPGRVSRSGRVVGRLGQDRFGLLFDARVDAEGQLVDRVPEWALARIEEPFLFDTLESGARTGAHRLTASAGWAHAGQGNFSLDGMLAVVDGALARAKSAGAGQVRVFDPARPVADPARRWVQDHLARGIAAGEFQLHYQPVVRLSDRALLGFEALLRWQHPQRGLVLPGDFLPAAEESGQIVEIGRWMLIEAALQLRRWRESGFQGEIAVNISGVHLARGAELLNDVREALKALGEAPSARLRIEVAEGPAMDDPQRAAEVLQALARLGVPVSIDDVGTGFSSLAQLPRFPFDTLKIDRGIVARLDEGSASRDVVRAVVGLVGALGRQALAEGVEDEIQALRLAELGVHAAQGFLFAKAVPPEEARQMIVAPPWATTTR